MSGLHLGTHLFFFKKIFFKFFFQENIFLFFFQENIKLDADPGLSVELKLRQFFSL